LKKIRVWQGFDIVVYTNTKFGKAIHNKVNGYRLQVDNAILAVMFRFTGMAWGRAPSRKTAWNWHL